jgi:hypothetical protein
MRDRATDDDASVARLDLDPLAIAKPGRLHHLAGKSNG